MVDEVIENENTVPADDAAENGQADVEETLTGEETAADEADGGADGKDAETCEGCDDKKKQCRDKEKEKDKDHKKDKKKSAAETARAEAKIEELEKKLAEEKDRYTRLAAEYDNYRKRTARELDGRYTDGKADAWKNLLGVADNFERALAAEPAGEEKDAFREGMELTYKLLKEQMDKAGVKEIEAKGQEFDPELHNAVMHCEDETLGENVVADVFVKGYKLGDKVLRHSMVKVAN